MTGWSAGRAAVALVAAAVGVVLLSGTDAPPRATAHPYPHWQELAPPPLAARANALGIRVGHRVLVLGGHGAGTASRALPDGAAYDLATGSWEHLRLPVAVTDRDEAAAAAGVVVLRHRAQRRDRWWRYDVRGDTWAPMRRLPAHLHAPSALGSEVYALSGRRVVVYSVSLGRWTPLPRDPLRPALHARRVDASRGGTVVTGCVTGLPGVVADRWNGVHWRRLHHVPASPPQRATAAHIAVGGRLVVFLGDRAWIHTP